MRSQAFYCMVHIINISIRNTYSRHGPRYAQQAFGKKAMPSKAVGALRCLLFSILAILAAEFIECIAERPAKMRGPSCAISSACHSKGNDASSSMAALTSCASCMISCAVPSEHRVTSSLHSSRLQAFLGFSSRGPFLTMSGPAVTPVIAASGHCSPGSRAY